MQPHWLRTNTRGAMYRLGRTALAVAMVGGVLSPHLTRAGEAAAEAAMRSVRDGVYRTEQAEKGKAAYASQCASCHDKARAGSEPSAGAPLVGNEFLERWQDMSVGDLLARIRTTMPLYRQGSLSDEVYLSIVAYLLQHNGFPPGPKPLTNDAQVLNRIRIETAK